MMFPYHYGLSYSSIDFENIEVIVDNAHLMIRFDASNASNYKGIEEALVFVSYPKSNYRSYYKELKGTFTTKEIPGNESRSTSIAIRYATLALYDEATSQNILPSGDYYIWLGKNSRDAKIIARIHLNNEVVIDKIESNSSISKEDTLDSYSYEAKNVKAYQLDSEDIKII